MSYKKRLFYLTILDSLIVLTSIYITNSLLLLSYLMNTKVLIISSITLFICHHTFAYIYKLYKRAWEYASIGELIAIFKAVTISITITGVVQLITSGKVYVGILTVTWMIHILLIGGSRFTWRLSRDRYKNKRINKKRALIVGAGEAGTMIVRHIQNNDEGDFNPVVFIDDDINKKNLNIMGISVVGGIEDIGEVVTRFKITNIIIAIPSLSKQELNKIYNQCVKTQAKTQIVPRIEELILGTITIDNIRNVQVEDLLGRDPIELITESIFENIKDKIILVTGAGGSIGSEICRQVAKYSPRKLILLGHGENSIYSIDMELKEIYEEIELVTEIADIQDRKKIFELMKFHKPDVLYHAAAHKHVPLMELNPDEAIKNNVIGTKNLAEAANTHNVNTFVMLSTDKAVNPTSVMGATKRLAEMIIQYMDSVSKTRYVAVRFGNVLGSRGSVIPRFKEQIKKGGPLTITDPKMQRYFMTIPEASKLVIQAGALAKGGEVLVLDMGEPVKIIDLAKNLIRLSGYSEDEIEIKYTGKRPGEKLYEELLNENEIHSEQIYQKIYRGKCCDINMNQIDNLIETFNNIENESLKKILLQIVNNKIEEEILTNF
ncbi:MAG: polysaccharide biosynthesis protein [Vulcanibacillus sp.]